MAEKNPIIAIVGNVTTGDNAITAAEDIGRELAKAGFRILVYSSGADFLEGAVVRGYISSQTTANGAIQVRYPFGKTKPAFPEQQSHKKVFEWHPDDSHEWEVSFYQSLNEIDGILLMGGGPSTMIAGLVALGHRRAVLALTAFEGKASDVWKSLRPGRDLVSHDEKALMARPDWSPELAAECVQALKDQLTRRAEEDLQRRLKTLREEASLKWHAIIAVILFLLSVACAPYAWGEGEALGRLCAMWLLFLSPLVAGVSGATIRLLFDLRQGTVPLSPQSTITTAALGLIAGGVAGLLFIIAQTTAIASEISAVQAGRLVPFGIVIGFLAGLTLDAVFRKLLLSDVIALSAIESKKGS
ncbi:MAG: hypothetical protein EPN21_16150 [Methylococcaceae bacterium]|nr:MAG: hypothetical protein EPN21_16150 [Methylococcaceae bacterium]